MEVNCFRTNVPNFFSCVVTRPLVLYRSIASFSRFGNFTQGAFDFSALLYYLSVMVVFLLLTGRIYDRRRYR